MVRIPELPLSRHFDAQPGRGSSVGADQGQPTGIEGADGVPVPVAH